jgi:glutathione S-transferase
LCDVMSLILYDSEHSVYARRVRLLAAELGLPLERRTLQYFKGEFVTPEYLAKNPTGRVPTLDDDGFFVWESVAIVKYIASLVPERGMSPTSPRQQAVIDQWLFWFVSHPAGAVTSLAQELLVKPRKGEPGHDPGIVAAAHAQLDRALPVLEKQLEGHNFILGDLSVVDFVVAPQIEALPVVKIDTAPFPNTNAWVKRMQAKPY